MLARVPAESSGIAFVAPDPVPKGSRLLFNDSLLTIGRSRGRHVAGCRVAGMARNRRGYRGRRERGGSWCREDVGPPLVNPRGWNGGRRGAAARVHTGRRRAGHRPHRIVLRTHVTLDDASVADLDRRRTHYSLLKIEVQRTVHRQFVLYHLRIDKRKILVTIIVNKNNKTCTERRTQQELPHAGPI